MAVSVTEETVHFYSNSSSIILMLMQNYFMRSDPNLQLKEEKSFKRRKNNKIEQKLKQNIKRLIISDKQGTKDF